MPTTEQLALQAKGIVLSRCLCCNKEMQHFKTIAAPLFCLSCEINDTKDLLERSKRFDEIYKRGGKRQKTQKRMIAKYGKSFI